MTIQRLLFAIGLFLISHSKASAQNCKITGVVSDKHTSEPLVYATVFCVETLSGGYTGSEGLFTLECPELDSIASLTITHVGYKDTTITIKLNSAKQKTLRVSLKQQSDLPLVDVRAARTTKGNTSSFFSPDIKALKAMPMLLGEVDILKSLTLLPGISTGLEGTSNIQIRGGNPSQTHLLIDGITLYNAGHFGGFLSSVDPYGVKAINVYKGGIPAKFGGRLSGVLEIDIRDGRKDQKVEEISIGTATLRYGREGSLGKKGKYLASGRFSYPSLLVNAFSSGGFDRGKEGNKTVASMYDDMFKTKWELGKGTLSTFVFTTGDFGLLQEVSGNTLFLDEYNWNTNAFGAAYDILLNNSSSINIKGYTSRYAYTYEAFVEEGRQLEERANRTLEQTTKLNDLNLSVDLNWFSSNLIKVSGGIDLKRHRFSSTASENFTDQPGIQLLNDRSNGLEYGLYGQVDLNEYSNKVTGLAGFRVSGLSSLNGSINFEPRVRTSYQFVPNIFLNIGYDRNAQYLHQLTTSNAIFPNDVWILADQSFAPSTSEQVYAGFALALFKESTTISIEAFAKKMDNLITLRDFSVDLFSLPADWRNTIANSGDGQVRGLELSIQKSTGRISGWIAYTLSKSERRYDDINDGQWFPFSFDRTHDGAVTLQYSLPNGWSFSTNFIYQTGAAVTFPISATAEYFIFDDINNARLPPYHRLDLSFSRSFQGKKKKHVWHTISLGVYNAYNRRNPVDFRLEPNSQVGIHPTTGQLILVDGFSIRQRAIFPIIPSISYKWEIPSPQ